MSTYVWCELVCNHCNEVLAGQFESGRTLPRAALKQEAKKSGAVFSGDDVFCNRRCHQDAQPAHLKEPRP